MRTTKENFESIARTFSFDRILNNDTLDPDENIFHVLNFKNSYNFTVKKSSS